MGRPPKPFWDYVDIRGSDECWNWLGGVTKANGHGKYHVPKSVNTTTHAHRYAWILINGDIPVEFPALCVLHTCDNGACCNPNHLYLGTKLQNGIDAAERHRFPSRHTKLTDNQVKEIRGRCNNGETQRKIAMEFAVSPSTISSIVRHIRRKQVK